VLPRFRRRRAGPPGLQLRGGRVVILRRRHATDTQGGDSIYRARLGSARAQLAQPLRPADLGELRARAELAGRGGVRRFAGLSDSSAGRGRAAMHRTSHVANYAVAQPHVDRSITYSVARGLALLGDHSDFVDLVRAAPLHREAPPRRGAQHRPCGSKHPGAAGGRIRDRSRRRDALRQRLLAVQSPSG
jgi:hypothetical protein